MDESAGTVIDRQRKLLREFNELNQTSLEVHAEAERKREIEQGTARATLNSNLESASAQLAEVQRVLQLGRDFVTEQKRPELLDVFFVDPSTPPNDRLTSENVMSNLNAARAELKLHVESAPSYSAPLVSGIVSFFVFVILLSAYLDPAFALWMGIGLAIMVSFIIRRFQVDSDNSTDQVVRERFAICVRDVAAWHAAQIKDANHLYQTTIREIDERCQQFVETTRADASYRFTNEILPELENIRAEAERATPQWSDPPKVLGSHEVQPGLLRLGTMSSSDGVYQITQPALFSFPGSSGLLFSTNGAATQQAVDAVRSLILQFLQVIPPGKLQFTFIDPAGLGQNVVDFLALNRHNENLGAGKAWTDPRHIEQQLNDLSGHIETVIKDHLGNQFKTIEEANKESGDIKASYRLLVVFDFPVNFSEDSANRLRSIMQKGSPCGVYTIIVHDYKQSLPHGVPIEDLMRSSIIVKSSMLTSSNDDEVFSIGDADYGRFTLELDSPPPLDAVQKLVTTWGKASQASNRVEVPFERIAPAESDWWTSSSAAGLSALLGPNRRPNEVQALQLGEGDKAHVLVVGRTGSGKSRLLHTMITNLSLRYSPSELELYLIDFKQGVEFQPYADFKLPHARVIAIESEREYGLSVLKKLHEELERRGEIFKAQRVNNLVDYRARAEAAAPLPRMMLIVDEFQQFFAVDDGFADDAKRILGQLMRQGRSYGLHVVLGSQTLAGSQSLERGTMEQMAVRIALMCSEADSRLILADDNPAARTLSRPGEAIYNDQIGRVEGNKDFQVALLKDDTHNQYLERLRERAEVEDYIPNQNIFDGAANAKVEENKQIEAALHSSQAVTPAALAYLGDPIAIRAPVAAKFLRQSGSNLLIVGQRDTQALGMLATSIVSLAAHLTAPPPLGQHAFYILDLGTADVERANPFERLASEPSLPIKLGRRRQLPAMIDEIAGIVKRRVDKLDGTAPTAEIGGYEGPIYVIVHGLQHARDLRQDDSFGFSTFDEEPAANPAQQFTTILDDGPDAGVHTLVWCNTVTNVNRTLDHRALRNFAMKVVFQMSAEDSANLINETVAAGLGPYRAYFYNEDENLFEKIRPYDLPSDDWLDWAARNLSARFARPADLRIADGG